MLSRIIRILFRLATVDKRHKAFRPSRRSQKSISVYAKRSADDKQIDTPASVRGSSLTGSCYVVDGDTIQIGKVRIRLAGIDAPELEHPWGVKAKWALVGLCKGQSVRAEFEPYLSYNRVVATCYLPDGRGLSAEMVRLGMALDWPKFSGGKYTEFEPEGVRLKHWKAAARQRGDMYTFHR